MTDDLQDRLDRLEILVDQHTDLLGDVVNGPRPTPPQTPNESDLRPEPAEIDPVELVTWVHRNISAVIARPIRGELRWCPRWWEHAEALFRFEALRRAWIDLAADPGTSLSIWIRDHLDPCLRELLSPTGPFADCDDTERFGPIPHTPLATLHTAPYLS